MRIHQLFAAAVVASPLLAQTPQAIYPLLTDLVDATATYADVQLLGTTPPSGPANGVCTNGIYYLSTNGQDVRTPNITSLDINDFQIDVEFEITALPSFQMPVVMAGNGWRWIGIYVQANGTIGMKYNNNNFTWSTTTVTSGQWYSASIRFEAGDVELHLDGSLIHSATIGPLTTGNNHNFTTNDFSNGGSFYGCIRNLMISNDTTLGMLASATDYGAGCDGLTLTASGLPQLGNGAFALVVGNVPAALPIAFLGFGSGAINPGVDLTPLGMAGCEAYVSLDLGLYGPAAAAGTDATFILPIPNNPVLTGASLAAQGVALSPATALGIIASNGTRLVFGP